MSGHARAEKSCEWFKISIKNQIGMNVAIVENVDGSVSVPGDYFENEENGYLNRIAKLEPELSNVLKGLVTQDSILLLPYDTSLPAINDSDAVPCNINFSFSLKEGFDVISETRITG